MISLWYHYGTFVVSLCCQCGFIVTFIQYRCDVTVVSLCINMLSLWYLYGITTISLWYHYGNIVLSRWRQYLYCPSHGTPFPWYCEGPYSLGFLSAVQSLFCFRKGHMLRASLNSLDRERRFIYFQIPYKTIPLCCFLASLR